MTGNFGFQIGKKALLSISVFLYFVSVCEHWIFIRRVRSWCSGTRSLFDLELKCSSFSFSKYLIALEKAKLFFGDSNETWNSVVNNLFPWNRENERRHNLLEGLLAGICLEDKIQVGKNENLYFNTKQFPDFLDFPDLAVNHVCLRKRFLPTISDTVFLLFLLRIKSPVRFAGFERKPRTFLRSKFSF